MSGLVEQVEVTRERLNQTMLLTELQHAARNLSRAPRFTVACVFTLAFALAGTATLLNLLEANPLVEELTDLFGQCYR